MISKFLVAVAACSLALTSTRAAETVPTIPTRPVSETNPPAAAADKLNILWTSQDKEVALKMVFMYAINAKKQAWWKDVEIIIWGPSARLTAADKDIQAYLKKMQDAGVVIKACRACADQYDVSKTLEKLGIEVDYMGQPLTKLLKKGEKLMTF